MKIINLPDGNASRVSNPKPVTPLKDEKCIIAVSV